MIYVRHTVGVAIGFCVALAGCAPAGMEAGNGFASPGATAMPESPGGFRGFSPAPNGQTPTSGPQRRTRPGVSPIVRTGPLRAVWVTRYDYRTPADIARIMEDCRSVGLNGVIFQVRGYGTAYYASRIEPRADELVGADPGFDPLDVALAEAHDRGLELHAWVNAMPGWRGPDPPRDPRQLYNAHPDWFWYDQRGQRQPLSQMNEGRREGRYVSVNPCLPEVRQYLVSVFEEIVTNYPVDGLHLDYIRFPNENAPRGVDYPRDPRTLALYRAATGRTPSDSRAIWSQWRTEQVSRLVYETRVMMRRVRPQMKLSASVGPDPRAFKADHFQDGETWAAKDWVDYLFPMNYTSSELTFIRRGQAWRWRAHGKPIVMGIGLYAARTAQDTIRQLDVADRWKQGFSLFAYSSLLTPPAGTGPADAGNGSSAQQAQRLAAIRRTLVQIAGR